VTTRRGRLGPVPSGLLVATLALVVLACGQPLESEAGLVVTVDSPSIGRVDGFELRTDDGEIIAFDTTEMDFRPEFPAAHVAEHQRMAEPVRVTYRRVGERRIVVRLADEL
jgi:hypothetical protein